MRTDAGDPFETLSVGFDELMAGSGTEAFLGRLVDRMSDRTGAYVARVTQLPIAQVSGQKRVEEFRRTNVALIKDLGDEHARDLSDILRQAAATGARHEDVAPLIQERLGVGLSRAKLIARDQTTKLNGQLQQDHQEAAGITEYTWSAAHDEAVRPMHKALDGKRFKFSEPPVVNKKGERRNPGGDIQCRCVAIPVIPLFEDLAPQQFPGALVPDTSPARAPGNAAQKAAVAPAAQQRFRLEYTFPDERGAVVTSRSFATQEAAQEAARKLNEHPRSGSVSGFSARAVPAPIKAKKAKPRKR
jgi:SPP1 gp7 family putative phage head morphogenesis protein